MTAGGFEPADGESTQVDLGGEGPAQFLGFRSLPPDELADVKRHVAEDLLGVHHSRLTYSLMAMAALAVLYRHANGVGRFALWLRGLTGAGKSVAAKLFANMFGDFPIDSGRFVSWSSTPNYVQDRGYYFKDALYVVDDFKPDVTRNEHVVRILQAYADNHARGRLNSRAGANPTREIRGLLVCTAEDLPEHSASVIGRSVVVTVPQEAKDHTRYQHCLQYSAMYSGMMADFVRYVIASGWTARFVGEVEDLRLRLLSGVEGRQNDARVASNLALMGAAFRAACEYLGDVWPEANDRADHFVGVDLIALRDEMLASTREQQTSEVFLNCLAELIDNKRVTIEGWAQHTNPHAGIPVVGRAATVPGIGSVFKLSTQLCLEEVNRSLRTQGRPIVAASERTLIEQLLRDGRLYQPPLQPARGGAAGGARGRPNVQISLDNRNRRGFMIAAPVLFGPDYSSAGQSPRG